MRSTMTPTTTKAQLHTAILAFALLLSSTSFHSCLVANASSCADVQGKFATTNLKTGGKRINRTCNWVKKRSRNWRCNKFVNVKEKCPDTCGLCPPKDEYTIAALGTTQTCARRVQNTTLFCWGDNQIHQLADGTTTDVNTPTAVDFVDPVAKVAMGFFHSCMITNTVRNLFCWGYNNFGQLGLGDDTDDVLNYYTEPTIIPNLRSGLLDIGVGLHYTCAITSDEDVVCFGSNEYKQVPGCSLSMCSSPTKVPLSAGTTAKQLAVGGDHTCIIDNNDDVQCFGRFNNGVTGCDGSNCPLVNTVSLLPGTKAKAIAVGYDFNCIIDSNDDVQCWGAHSGWSGSVGSGTGPNPSLATLVGGVKAKQIALGWNGGCVIDSNGTLQCFGANDVGQMGNGSTDDHYSVVYPPTIVEVSPGSRTIMEVGCGGGHVCAVDDLNQLFCWGANYYGQVGDGTFNNPQTRPVQITF